MAALTDVHAAVRRVEIGTPTRVRVVHGLRFVGWVVDRHLRHVTVLDWPTDHVEDAA